MRVRDDAADHDRAPSEIGERAPRDFDRSRSKADPGVVRVGVVADAERDLAELGEAIVVKDHTRRGGDLHRRRLLTQSVAHRFERPAAPAAIADRIGRIARHLPREKGAALLAGIAFRTRGPSQLVPRKLNRRNCRSLTGWS